MGKNNMFGPTRKLNIYDDNKTKDKAQSNHIMMTQGSVPLVILRMASGTMITMLVATTYNLVDMYFVSGLGKSQVGAVGIMFSVMALIQAVGYTFGMGAGSLISRFLGRCDKETAEKTLACSFFSSIIVGTVLGIAGIIFLEPLIGLIGSTDTIEEYAKDYGIYIMLATPVMCGAYVLNNCLRAEGKPYLALTGVVSGGLTNLILDYILIRVFETGIAGAGIATLSGQAVSMIVMLFCFAGKNSIIKIRISGHKKMGKFGKGTLFDIIKCGMPSFWRQGLMCFAAILLNRSCMQYGDDAVAGISISNKIFAVIFALLVGYGQGFAPVAGYNYGANKKNRVKTAAKTSVINATIAMSIIALVIYFTAPYIVGMFSNEEAVAQISVLALRAHAVSMPFMPMCLISGMLFQAMGAVYRAAFISSLRQGIFFLPLIWMLPMWFATSGIAWALPLSDILAGISSTPFLVHAVRKG